MSNPYLSYYSEQAGDGISHFSGLKYQKGHGIGSFFGRLFKSLILPSAKYLGKKALKTGVDIGSDVLEGQSFKESAKKRVNEILDKINQKGRGYKKRQKKQPNTDSTTMARSRRVRRKTYKKKRVYKRRAPLKRRRRKTRSSIANLRKSFRTHLL